MSGDGKNNLEMTGTELMLCALESFGEHEPDKVVIVWTSQKGAVLMMSNARRCEALGMLITGADAQRNVQ